MITALVCAFLAGALAGALAHARITRPSPRRRRQESPARGARQIKLTPPADSPAVVDLTSALKNMGATPAAALTAARKVIAERPAADFQEHFRVALRELPSSSQKGRHAVN